VVVTLVAIGLAALAHTYIELKGVEWGKRAAGPARSKAANSHVIAGTLEPQIDRAA
jgi:peptidoglycan/LPS O-acetylase OafA/YrhL